MNLDSVESIIGKLISSWLLFIPRSLSVSQPKLKFLESDTKTLEFSFCPYRNGLSVLLLLILWSVIMQYCFHSWDASRQLAPLPCSLKFCFRNLKFLSLLFDRRSSSSCQVFSNLCRFFADIFSLYCFFVLSLKFICLFSQCHTFSCQCLFRVWNQVDYFFSLNTAFASFQSVTGKMSSLLLSSKYWTNSSLREAWNACIPNKGLFSLHLQGEAVLSISHISFTTDLGTWCEGGSKMNNLDPLVYVFPDINKT